MQIEVISPACLLFGFVQLEGRLCQLGVTLRYPPVQLLARAAPALSITGGRADLAYRQAERFFERHRLPPQAEIEIELAIPAFMGLGSHGMLGLSVARALAVLHGQPVDDIQELARAVDLDADEALEAHAFAQGGLLLVDSAGVLRHRQPIAEHDEAEDWVFVLALPRVPSGTPETLEADRRQILREAAGLDPQTGRICASQLGPAVEGDDIAEFARGLMAIQTANHAALDQFGKPLALSSDEQSILEVMREGGALAWGRCILGMGLYGLIKGGGPSRELRRRLAERQGYFGATVMATLCDSDGAQQRVVGS
jgi:beta-ribofuranosylaminobenzene 5'-phosphate synthase